VAGQRKWKGEERAQGKDLIGDVKLWRKTRTGNNTLLSARGQREQRKTHLRKGSYEGSSDPQTPLDSPLNKNRQKRGYK